MATSPNYSWPEPDNTDLVKNGALAIRTMGNAIDTTMATMTPKSTYTAKGSIAAATGASTPANLSVGNNGETLVADSSTSTGLRYTAGNPIPNPVLNSAFQIWQRGTSVAVTSSAYTADRWMGYRASAGGTVSRQVTNDTTNLPNIQYCARVQRNSGNTSTDYIAIVNSFETINSIPYAGKTVTLSFYARAGANYSSTSNLMQVVLTTGTGTDQNALLSYTGGTNIVSQAATLTTTWQRFTYTAAVGSTATELGMYFYFSPTGTAGANDFFEITGVQIDIGSVALPFRTNGATLQGELAACQRYYYRQSANATNFIMDFGLGTAPATTTFEGSIILPVQMRIPPTSLDSASLQATDLNTNFAITSPTIGTARTGVNVAHVSGTISGATQYRSYFLGSASSSGYIGLSAEL